jgi:hypothetical protein
MALSAILEMLNASFMMLFLLILAMISPAKAQTVTCDSSSPQCCTVLRIREIMTGQSLLADSTSATACCNYLGSTTQSSGIEEVYCNSDGIVTEIRWSDKNLTGDIPSDIGNLVDLEQL